jgi:hypothetical protein
MTSNRSTPLGAIFYDHAVLRVIIDSLQQCSGILFVVPNSAPNTGRIPPGCRAMRGQSESPRGRTYLKFSARARPASTRRPRISATAGRRSPGAGPVPPRGERAKPKAAASDLKNSNLGKGFAATWVVELVLLDQFKKGEPCFFGVPAYLLHSKDEVSL